MNNFVVLVIETETNTVEKINSYRYGNVVDTGASYPVSHGVCHFWETNTLIAAENQVDRLLSGWISAKLCITQEEIDTVLADWVS